MSECPFCGRDPFHYVDNGLGMEAVAVTCCELGDLFFRGDRPAPEEVTLSWEEFMDVGSRIASANATLADVEMGLQSAQIEHLEVQLASARKALEFIAEGYDNQDINHVDYRVKVYQVATETLEEIA